MNHFALIVLNLFFSPLLLPRFTYLSLAAPASDSFSISPMSPHDGTRASVASHIGLEHGIDGRKPSSAGALRSRKDTERNQSSHVHRGLVGNLIPTVNTLNTLTATATPIKN